MSPGAERTAAPPAARQGASRDLLPAGPIRERGIGPVIHILMLGAPPDLDAEQVLEAMQSERLVGEVHHLHLWQIDESTTALEAHVVVFDAADGTGVRDRLRAMLQERFGIGHTTLGLKSPRTRCNEAPAIGH